MEIERREWEMKQEKAVNHDVSESRTVNSDDVWKRMEKKSFRGRRLSSVQFLLGASHEQEGLGRQPPVPNLTAAHRIHSHEVS